MESISDKKFLMVFTVVMGILFLLGFIVFFAANMAGNIEYKKSDAQVQMASERIAPVGKVNLASSPNVGSAVVAEAAAVVATPEGLYQGACAACHAAGVLGAPKFGDKAAWSSRVGKGLDVLTANAINGIGTMPAKGGSALPDDEIKSIVEYMLKAL